jgi:hypothetical protein
MLSLRRKGIERREHPRVHFCADAEVSQDGRTLGPAVIQNLSEGGAMLAGNCQPDVGSIIQVRVTSGRLVGAWLRGEVRWALLEAGQVKFGILILPEETRVARLIQEVVLDELERAGREPEEDQTP